MLPQRSRDKCRLVSVRDTPAALDEVVASDELPAFLGGSLEQTASIGRAEPVPVGLKV